MENSFSVLLFGTLTLMCGLMGVGLINVLQTHPGTLLFVLPFLAGCALMGFRAFQITLSAMSLAPSEPQKEADNGPAQTVTVMDDTRCLPEGQQPRIANDDRSSGLPGNTIATCRLTGRPAVICLPPPEAI